MTSDVLKICGITRLADALHAVEQGATALGLRLLAEKPAVRRVRSAPRRSSRRCRPAVTTVGVFVNERSTAIRATVERRPASRRCSCTVTSRRRMPMRSSARCCASVTLDDAETRVRRVAGGDDVAARRRRSRCGAAGPGVRVDWTRGRASLARSARWCWPAA